MIHHPERLAGVHSDLAVVITAAGGFWDLDVIEGERSLERERELIGAGKSKLTDPMRCLHVRQVDGYVHAVDVAPWPATADVWKDTRRFYLLGGFVLGVASQLKKRIRWGGDWNGNTVIGDQTFNDLDHFEVPMG